jgi:hypothetical protein
MAVAGRLSVGFRIDVMRAAELVLRDADDTPRPHLHDRARHRTRARARQRSGQEVTDQIAMVILGGLFTSTAPNLFLPPAIFLRYGQAPELTARP